MRARWRSRPVTAREVASRSPGYDTTTQSRSSISISLPRSGAEHAERHRQPVVAVRDRRGRAAADRDPAMRMPSGSSSASTPIARRLATDGGDAVALLHAQLARAGDRPSRPRRAPRDRRAAAARRSSTGRRLASIVDAAQTARRARRRSATDSPPSTRRFSSRRRDAPMRRSCAKKAGSRLVDADALESQLARVGERGEPGEERGRRRIARARACRAACSVGVRRRASPSFRRRAAPRRAPRASARCGRATAPARSTRRSHAGARAPARRIALLTCALATSLCPVDLVQRAAANRHRQPAVRRQLDASRPSPRAAARRGASDAGSGSRRRRTSRAMGERGDDAGHSRVVVPLLPQSSSRAGCAQPRGPTPRSTKSSRQRRDRRRRARAARRRSSARRPTARMPRDARRRPSAERAEDQRAVRDRLVARNAQRAGRPSSQPAPRARSRGRSSRRGTSRSPAPGARAAARRPSRP